MIYEYYDCIINIYNIKFENNIWGGIITNFHIAVNKTNNLQDDIYLINKKLPNKIINKLKTIKKYINYNLMDYKIESMQKCDYIYSQMEISFYNDI